jgi:hypothetical protein
VHASVSKLELGQSSPPPPHPRWGIQIPPIPTEPWSTTGAK